MAPNRVFVYIIYENIIRRLSKWTSGQMMCLDRICDHRMNGRINFNDKVLSEISFIWHMRVASNLEITLSTLYAMHIHLYNTIIHLYNTIIYLYNTIIYLYNTNNIPDSYYLYNTMYSIHCILIVRYQTLIV